MYKINISKEEKRYQIGLLNYLDECPAKSIPHIINKLSDNKEEYLELSNLYKETKSRRKTIDDLTESEKYAVFQMFNGAAQVSPQEILSNLYENREDFNGRIDGFFTYDENYSFELLYKKVFAFTLPELVKLSDETGKCWDLPSITN